MTLRLPPRGNVLLADGYNVRRLLFLFLEAMDLQLKK